jgi:hypothetical protein
MELNRDIISNISKYLNDYEIIYLSSTCKQYYDMCNNYLIFQRLFDDLPFGINNCVCDKVNKSLFSYGYCKRKIKNMLINEPNYNKQIISDDEIFANSTLVERQYNFGPIDNDNFSYLNYNFRSTDPYILGITDMRLILFFDKNIHDKEIFIPYWINIGSVRLSASDIKMYKKLKRIHDKNSFISDNMCIYPLLFGFSIIPILLNMKSGIIKCKFPNYNDNKIIHACVVMNHILMSPSNKIYNSIMMNKTFDRPCLLESNNIGYYKIFENTNDYFFDDREIRGKILQYCFYFADEQSNIITHPMFEKISFNSQNSSIIHYNHDEIEQHKNKYYLYFAKKSLHINLNCYMHDILIYPKNIIFFGKPTRGCIIHMNLLSLTYLSHDNNDTKLECNNSYVHI